MKFSNILCSTVVSSVFLGCATLPDGLSRLGSVTTHISEFDQTREVTMEPGWVYGTPMKIGLFKNSKMEKNRAILRAVARGTYSFGRGKNLHFKIDGKTYSFASKDTITDVTMSSGYAGGGIYVPGVNWSTKDYVVGMDFLRKLDKGKKVLVKLELQKTFLEGPLHKGGPTTAKSGFSTFLKTVDNNFTKVLTQSTGKK